MNDEEKPLTKKDLLEALGAMENRLEERFDSKLASLEERLREYVHDTETKLLTAFHEFSTANNDRLAALEEVSSHTTKRLALLEAAGRLSALELRVAEIEKKLDRRQ